MISMTKTRLGALRCPHAAYVGSEALVVFGGGVDFSQVDSRWFFQQPNPVKTVRNVDLIPSIAAVDGTRLSAPPDRSP